MLFRVICLGFIAFSSLYSTESEQAFTNIYDNHIWGKNEEGRGHSGGGSTVSNTVIYRAFLQKFLKENNITSVVDIGCGDWEFSKTINWDNVTYTGYDVVRSVIERNKKVYQKPNIVFIHGDVTELDLPEADLMVTKDVLQHLPNEYIKKILKKTKQFKYCLITNDLDSASYSSDNHDTKVGGYRPLDLTKSPFFVNAQKVLTFQTSCGVKQVILIKN